jgi:D-sedoheptulose 7-phosphate isomerase
MRADDERRLARVGAVLRASAALHEATVGACGQEIAEAGRLVADCLAQGGQVLAFGNGGSAADAQHFVAELVGRYEAGRSRRAWPALSLASDASVTTALANDLGYAEVFARQVEAFGRAGDVALGITTSGTSENVRRGLAEARARGLRTIALTGQTDQPLPVDVQIAVPERRTPRVQEVHGTVLHILCELVEEAL